MDNDTKVKFVIGTVHCEAHRKAEGEACWTTPARTDGLSPVRGVCMGRAARSGILTPAYKREWLGIKRAA